MTSIATTNRRIAGIIAVVLAGSIVTACGSESDSDRTTTRNVVDTTTRAPQQNTTVPTPGAQGLPVGRTQQIVGTDNGGYAAAISVTRIWRSSRTQVNANVVYDVSRGVVPASRRWTLVESNGHAHVGSVKGPITGHSEATITFHTPSNISASFLRFGEGASITTWSVPALSRYATSTKRTTTKRTTTTTKRTTKATKTKTRTTRTRRTTR